MPVVQPALIHRRLEIVDPFLFVDLAVAQRTGRNPCLDRARLQLFRAQERDRFPPAVPCKVVLDRFALTEPPQDGNDVLARQAAVEDEIGERAEYAPLHRAIRLGVVDEPRQRRHVTVEKRGQERCQVVRQGIAEQRLQVVLRPMQQLAQRLKNAGLARRRERVEAKKNDILLLR